MRASNRASWEMVPLSAQSVASTTEQAVAAGESLLLIPGVASALEIRVLRSAALTAAADPEKEVSPVGGSFYHCDRMKVQLALPKLWPVAKVLLRRVLSLVDKQLPEMRALLFGTMRPRRLRSLLDQGRLRYAVGEPAINVYSEGGEFDVHIDGRALTVLIPLSRPELEFSGKSHTTRS